MKQMTANAFKAKCAAVMRHVRETGEPVIVTLNGKPALKLTRIEPGNDDVFGFMRNKGKIVGDIESPIPVEWKVMRRRKKK
jgi:prevent-host-death family protein